MRQIVHMYHLRILRAKEYGLNALWNRRFHPNRPKCSQKVTPYEAVPLECVLVALYVICTGAALSVLSLLIESSLTRTT